MSVQLEWFFQGLPQSFRHAHRGAGVCHVVDEDNELVTPQARQRGPGPLRRDGVSGANRDLQAMSDGYQDAAFA